LSIPAETAAPQLQTAISVPVYAQPASREPLARPSTHVPSTHARTEAHHKSSTTPANANARKASQATCARPRSPPAPTTHARMAELANSSPAIKARTYAYAQPATLAPTVRYVGLY
jgi:hypothetical protein